jgi:predicted amidohydrolase YtcJ
MVYTVKYLKPFNYQLTTAPKINHSPLTSSSSGLTRGSRCLKTLKLTTSSSLSRTTKHAIRHPPTCSGDPGSLFTPLKNYQLPQKPTVRKPSITAIMETVQRQFTNFYISGTETKQSMIVENGKIKNIIPNPITKPKDAIDLQEQTICPAFIDNHCHLIAYGMDVQKVHLDQCTTKDQMLEKILQAHHNTESNRPLFANRYDASILEPNNKLNLDHLDNISKNRPIIVQSVNGHSGVANTAALTQAKIKPAENNNSTSGHTNGQLAEYSYFKLLRILETPDVHQMANAILVATKQMSSCGITCATDMMTGFYDLQKELEAFSLAIQQGCPIQIRFFIDAQRILGSNKICLNQFQDSIKQYNSKDCRFLGLKFFADGALGSETASIHGSYLSGKTTAPIYNNEKLLEMMQQTESMGYSISVHAIGDQAVDQVLDTFEQLQHPQMHRIEHALLMSNKQIEKLVHLGVHCSMQPGFLGHHGDSYLKVLPKEKVAQMSRVSSVDQANANYSLSSDAPFGFINPWDNIHYATQRPQAFGHNENISKEKAFNAYTLGAAKGNLEQNTSGLLKEGYLANFQVYDQCPIKYQNPKLTALYKCGQAVFTSPCDQSTNTTFSSFANCI